MTISFFHSKLLVKVGLYHSRYLLKEITQNDQKLLSLIFFQISK